MEHGTNIFSGISRYLRFTMKSHFFGRILSTTLATLAGDAEESKGPVSTDLHLAARNGDLEKIDEMWLAAKLATCQFDGGIYQYIPDWRFGTFFIFPFSW